MNRRGFLLGVTSLLAAPAIVRASSLMPLASYMDDTSYIQSLINAGGIVRLPKGHWILRNSLMVPSNTYLDGLGTSFDILQGPAFVVAPDAQRVTLINYNMKVLDGKSPAIRAGTRELLVPIQIQGSATL